MTALVQIVISAHVAEEEDPVDTMRRILDQLPEGRDFANLGQKINGTWVDRDGKRL